MMADNFSESLNSAINSLIQSVEERSTQKDGGKSKLTEGVNLNDVAIPNNVPKKRASVEAEKLTESNVEPITPQPTQTRVDTQTPSYDRFGTVKRVAENMSLYAAAKPANDIVISTKDLTEQRIDALQRQINTVSASISGLRESTLVSGIGQGGDGQTPGSGEVLFQRLDDVDIDMDTVLPGQVIMWDGSNFVPGSVSGDGVVTVVEGTGITVNETVNDDNKEYEIVLNATTNDLTDVDLGDEVSDYAALVWDTDKFVPKRLKTDAVDLATPQGSTFKEKIASYSRNTTNMAVVTTQEQGNILIGETLVDIDARLVDIEIKGTGGDIYKGMLDITDANNKPDDALAGDYYINNGGDGKLWGNVDGDDVDVKDGDKAIYDGTTWDIIPSTDSGAKVLDELDDVHITGTPEDGQILAFDGYSHFRNVNLPDIPAVIFSSSEPDHSLVKDGDFWMDTDNNNFYLYQTDTFLKATADQITSINELDDVDIESDTPSDGQSLIWNSLLGKFVPGDVNITPPLAVDQLIAGPGIDIDPPGGVGTITISADLALEELRNINGTPSDGDLLIYDGTNWNVGTIDTSQLSLTNPQGIEPFGITRVDLVGPYLTQEDANQLFGQILGEYETRIDTLENATTPGTFLGAIDVTDSSNEPDTSTLNAGDYYIHEGNTGFLWGVGDSVEDSNQVIWDGNTWLVVSTVSTLAQLGDTDIDSAATGDFLVYNDVTSIWESASVPIPTVTVGAIEPNTGDEKDGDFWFDNANEVLYIFDSVWKVAGGSDGASVAISALPPTDPVPEEGNLWVSNDDWTLHVYDGSTWIALTNNGLVEDDLDDAYLRLTPQAKLGGPLLLSDDEITDDNQATTKEYVETKLSSYLPRIGGTMTGGITYNVAGTNTTTFRITDSSDNIALDIWAPGGVGSQIKYVAQNGTSHWFQNYDTSGNVKTTAKLKYQDIRLTAQEGVTYIGTDSHRFQGAIHVGNGDKGNQLKISPNSSDYAVNIFTLNGGQLRFRTSHTDAERDYSSHIILSPDADNPTTRIYNVTEAGSGTAVPRSYVDEGVDEAKTYTDEGVAEAKTYTDEQIAALPSASTGVPVGSIMIWMKSTPPSGWFKLQGGSFDVDVYPLLHAYLNSTDGYVSGTLPNWGGYYPGEYGNHLTGSLGRKVDYQTARPKTAFTTDNQGNHKHRYGNNAYGGGATNTAHDARNQSKYETDAAGAHTHTITGGGDSTTRPRTVIVHYIIKHD